ncbi:hypothetical protein KKZ87_05145 [Enterobacter cloacae]|uniref:hypothetical protein n=1 Tax=Enterobacter cloacae TaxID=550 RepID=UPI001BDDF110|nr:hypothetical protein [Enterobacter cloacae]MBT1834199.1 hypothetical protein [Enterobacter cloacae]HBL4999482.1 hypothetical protein [Enterobacter cloacae]
MNKVLLALLSCVLSVISFTGVAAEPRQEPTEQERARTIQDVFNEFNVQIMSPNFVMQPEGAVVVAEENWFAAPAEKPTQKPS